MASGKVPVSVAPYLCGARLHGVKKKDGGLRPIAVGNILRRLVGKCVAFSLADRAAAHLSPHQLGVAVQGGCESILHAVRAAVDDDPNMWVDQVNAFNLADRSTALQEVEQIFPEALAWTSTCYSSPS